MDTLASFVPLILWAMAKPFLWKIALLEDRTLEAEHVLPELVAYLKEEFSQLF